SQALDTTPPYLHYSYSKWCSWIRRRRFQRAQWPNDGNTLLSSCMACSWAPSSTPCTVTGSGEAVGYRNSEPISSWETATSTSLVHRWFTLRAEFLQLLEHC